MPPPVLRPTCPIREVRGFRFRRFVSPGDYTFRMECTDEGLRCSLHMLPHGHAGTEGHGMHGPGAAYEPDATPPPASPPLVTGVLAELSTRIYYDGSHARQYHALHAPVLADSEGWHA